MKRKPKKNDEKNDYSANLVTTRWATNTEAKIQSPIGQRREENMTAEQEIKAEIIRSIEKDGKPWCVVGITAENVDDIWEELRETDMHWDAMSEFRCSGEGTGIPADYSRHYESDSVGRKLSNGKWVGWTYWHGGGKHSDPDSIDWMDSAYFLNVTEEEKMVTVRTFSKAD